MRLRGLKDGDSILVDGSPGYFFQEKLGNGCGASVRSPSGIIMPIAARRISRHAPAKKEPEIRFKKGDKVDCDGAVALTGFSCVGGEVIDSTAEALLVKGPWFENGKPKNTDTWWAGIDQAKAHVPKEEPPWFKVGDRVDCDGVMASEVVGCVNGEVVSVYPKSSVPYRVRAWWSNGMFCDYHVRADHIRPHVPAAAPEPAKRIVPLTEHKPAPTCEKCGQELPKDAELERRIADIIMYDEESPLIDEVDIIRAAREDIAMVREEKP